MVVVVAAVVLLFGGGCGVVAVDDVGEGRGEYFNQTILICWVERRSNTSLNG